VAGQTRGNGTKAVVYLDLSRLKPCERTQRIICSVEAAVKYNVPANLILAVAQVEGGRPGQYVEDSNGTYDVGTMQFNTAYLRDLGKYGITAKDVAAPGCYAYDLAAWRLRGQILHDPGDFWTKAADYHSTTPCYNAEYRAKLIQAAAKWGRWLNKRFKTCDVPASGKGESK
jgi:soluble lytic murein transglycosylase-like protein